MKGDNYICSILRVKFKHGYLNPATNTGTHRLRMRLGCQLKGTRPLPPIVATRRGVTRIDTPRQGSTVLHIIKKGRGDALMSAVLITRGVSQGDFLKFCETS